MHHACPQPNLNEIQIGTVFSVLANPWRRHIVEQLLTRYNGTADTYISLKLGLSKSTLTHHMRVMSQAGLITQVDYGNHCAVTLRRAELDARFPGLLDLLQASAQVEGAGLDHSGF
jgi:DNA-binding transcriptional ArsR family regulator